MKTWILLVAALVLSAGCGSNSGDQKAAPEDHTGHNHAPGEKAH